MNLYAFRANLSVALVAMVNNTRGENNNNTTRECPADDVLVSTEPREIAKNGEFNWGPETQGIVLGSFFYGYVVTLIPGGILAEKFGGKILFGLGVLFVSILTLLTPVAARFHVGALIAVRILEGAAQGVGNPALHQLFGKWMPLRERSRLVAFTVAGLPLGMVVAMLISGFLSASDFLGGWPSVFYVMGTVGLLWWIAWMLFVADSPAQHPTISKGERDYIEQSLGSTAEKTPIPWRSILTSVPFWAILVAHVTNNWGFYTMFTHLPTYMNQVLHFDIAKNGVLSGLPFFVAFVILNIGGHIADYCHRSQLCCTTAKIRKLVNAIAMVSPGVCLIATSYVGCNATWAITLLTIGMGLQGLSLIGFYINHLDIAPKYASVMLGMTNCAATVPGFVAPHVIGYIIREEQTQVQWRIVFYIAGLLFIIGAIIFLIFAAGEVQPWAAPTLSDINKTATNGERRAIPKKGDNSRTISSEVFGQQEESHCQTDKYGEGNNCFEIEIPSAISVIGDEIQMVNSNPYKSTKL